MPKIKFDKDYYRSWENRYFKNPQKTVRDLKKINRYYKKYLLILRESSSKRFKNEIYRIIIDKFNEDIQNLKNKKKITTLGKWMPRENSSFDKELNFVETITKKMYPGLSPGNARRLYRNNIVELTKALNVVEVDMSAKNYDKIDVKKIPKIAMSMYNRSFSRNKNMCKKYSDEYVNRLLKKNTDEFIDTLLDTTLSVFENALVKNSFLLKREKYAKKHQIINDRCVPVLDTSTDRLIKKKFKKDLLTCLYILEKNDIIIINAEEPKIIEFDYKLSAKKKCQEIFKHMYDSDTVNVKGLLENLPPRSKLLIFSDKKIINPVQDGFTVFGCSNSRKNTDTSPILKHITLAVSIFLIIAAAVYVYYSKKLI